MRPIALALALSLLAALPCVAEDAWVLDGKHVVIVRASASDEVEAEAAKKELAAWVGERARAAKTPQVFVVGAESAATLVADLGKAGHALVERQAEDLRALSPQHAAVCETYADYLDLLGKAPGFRAKRRVQDDLTKRLQAREGLTRPIRDLILFSKSKQEQLFLARALAGFPSGPGLEHLAVLLLPEAPLVLSLARYLPEADPKSLALLKRAFPLQAEANCKTVLLREIAKLIGPKGDATFLREVAKDEEAEKELRAEAVTSLGRRGDPRDFETLAALCRKSDPMLRYRAIMGAANSDKVKALPLLRELRKDPEVRLRAGIVLALGQIGSEALPTLEEIAQDDPEEAIRTRAQRLLDVLKAKEEKGN